MRLRFDDRQVENLRNGRQDWLRYAGAMLARQLPNLIRRWPSFKNVFGETPNTARETRALPKRPLKTRQKFFQNFQMGLIFRETYELRSK
jgi:hypothetical protein